MSLDFTMGDRLRKAREHAGMQRQEIAEVCGIHRLTVSHYERDLTHPNRAVLMAWASATGVDLDWLEQGRLSA